jgi:hypothetical protein
VTALLVRAVIGSNTSIDELLSIDFGGMDSSSLGFRRHEQLDINITKIGNNIFISFYLELRKNQQP